MLAHNHKGIIINNRILGNKKWLEILGIVLVVFSFVLYASILLVPFSPFTVGTKGIICTILWILREISFWLGVIILGKKFVSKYFKYLNIFHWLNKKKHSEL